MSVFVGALYLWLIVGLFTTLKMVYLDKVFTKENVEFLIDEESLTKEEEDICHYLVDNIMFTIIIFTCLGFITFLLDTYSTFTE